MFVFEWEQYKSPSTPLNGYEKHNFTVVEIRGLKREVAPTAFKIIGQ